MQMQEMIKLAQQTIKICNEERRPHATEIVLHKCTTHHGQSDAIPRGALRGLCDRGSWPECSILARKVSAYQEYVHFNCLDIMPLPVVLFSVAAFCYFK